MARVGTLYQRLIDSFYYVGDALVANQTGVVVVNDDLILEIRDTGIYYFGTNVLWSSSPSGFVLAYNNTSYVANVTAYGYYIYLPGINTSTKQIRLYQLDTRTKSFTTLGTWTWTTSQLGWEMMGPPKGTGTHGCFCVAFNDGSPRYYVYDVDLVNGTTTLRANIYSLYTQPIKDITDDHISNSVDDDGYVYITTESGYNEYFRKSPIASAWSMTLIDSNADAYIYVSIGEGYHSRSDTSTLIHNQARSTSWNVGFTVYGGNFIGMDGTSKVCLLLLSDGLYVASLAVGGGVTKTRLNSTAPIAWRGATLSSRAIMDSGSGYTDDYPNNIYYTYGKAGTGNKMLFRFNLGKKDVV
jgi:hypothetical protein